MHKLASSLVAVLLIGCSPLTAMNNRSLFNQNKPSFEKSAKKQNRNQQVPLGLEKCAQKVFGVCVESEKASDADLNNQLSDLLNQPVCKNEPREKIFDNALDYALAEAAQDEEPARYKRTIELLVLKKQEHTRSSFSSYASYYGPTVLAVVCAVGGTLAANGAFSKE